MIKFCKQPIIPKRARQGANERRLRAELKLRPAGLLSGLDGAARACFMAMAGGAARPIGKISYRGGLSIGCLACEVDWRATWQRLEKLGLISTRETVIHGDRDGAVGEVRFALTDLGRSAYADARKWRVEHEQAVAADESSPAPVNAYVGARLRLDWDA